MGANAMGILTHFCSPLSIFLAYGCFILLIGEGGFERGKCING